MRASPLCSRISHTPSSLAWGTALAVRIVERKAPSDCLNAGSRVTVLVPAKQSPEAFVSVWIQPPLPGRISGELPESRPSRYQQSVSVPISFSGVPVSLKTDRQ
jgi:hypothetical protein